ncbi:MAG: hypothetical protein LBH43_20640 [Treponema sp.]|jgi:hypothetical protein|nr:hypothetical protein [Treponema sp.]
MIMARNKATKEKDIIDQLLDNIDFRGLTQDEVVWQDGIINNPEQALGCLFYLFSFYI